MRAAAALALLALAVGLGAGCRARRGDDRSELELALEAMDGLYSQRATAERLVEAQQAALTLLADAPEAPEVLWRLSRSYSAFAYGFPDASGEPCGAPGRPDPELCYTLAMEYAFRCMETNAAWSSRLAINSGRITKHIAASLGLDEKDCVEQAVTAWVRWVEIRGPSANLYLDSIAWLSRRSVELDEASWVGHWGLAMTQALPPPLAEPDLTKAAEHFDAAVSRSPELATASADRVIYLSHQLEDSALLAEIQAVRNAYAGRSSDPYALENRRAIKRLDSLLASKKALSNEQVR